MLPAKIRRSVYIVAHQVVRTFYMMKYTMYLIGRARVLDAGFGVVERVRLWWRFGHAGRGCLR